MLDTRDLREAVGFAVASKSFSAAAAANPTALRTRIVRFAPDLNIPSKQQVGIT